MEYQPLVLECVVSKPNRSATWYKDGSKLTSSDHLTIISEDKKHILTIDRLAMDDEAEYSIKVEDLTSKCTVLVEGKHSYSKVFKKKNPKIWNI